MDRQEQLEFCKLCTNRKFDTNQGLVCGLTGSIATFEKECPDYKLDIEESNRLERRQTERQQKLDLEAKSLTGLSAKAVIWVGLMIFLLGVFWIITSNIYFFMPAYWSIVPISIGLFIIAYGMNKRVAELRAEKKKTNTPT